MLCGALQRVALDASDSAPSHSTDCESLNFSLIVTRQDKRRDLANAFRLTGLSAIRTINLFAFSCVGIKWDYNAA